MRKAGVLLAVSGLPSNHGIGDFGNNAYRFIDDLNKSDFKIWQILPLNPLGYGNSPYQPYSSKAMDELYISLDQLKKDGLIKSELKNFNTKSNQVDYEAVRSFKLSYLEEAFSNFVQGSAYQAFKDEEWVYNFAVFMVLKKKNGNKQWNLWEKDDINWIVDKKIDLSHYEEEIEFEIFKQFILLEQWLKLKEYTNNLGIEIMGDIPFYVGLDSIDVYENRDAFLLDSQYFPTSVAGVPPDYFAEFGQRWGNPIYNWNYLKESDYQFWNDRIYYNSKLFDIVRIDHFRAFDTYWKIPATCPTAVEGSWEKAPGIDFFMQLTNKYPKIELVAEDLGDLSPGVPLLRDKFNFKGMKIMQFEIDPNEPSEMLSHPQNAICYLGTHDNSPIVGWYNLQSKKTQTYTDKLLRKPYYDYKPRYLRFLERALESNADYTIIAMQDLLGQGEKYRINVPGTIGYPNWAYKMVDFRKFETDLHIFKRLIKKYGR